jgi:transcriptional regulator with XRE-family HTH domain
MNQNLDTIGLDAKQLAQVLGISPATARSTLRGKRKLTLADAKKLSKMFDKVPTFFGPIKISVSDLYFEDLIQFVWNDRIIRGKVLAIGKGYLDSNKVRGFEYHIKVVTEDREIVDAVFGPKESVLGVELVDTKNKARIRNYTYGFLQARFVSETTTNGD